MAPPVPLLRFTYNARVVDGQLGRAPFADDDRKNCRRVSLSITRYLLPQKTGNMNASGQSE